MSRSIVDIDLDSHRYEIIIDRGLLTRAGEFLAPLLPSRNICIVTDEAVAALYLAPLVRALEAAGFSSVHSIVLPVGEKTKNFSQLEFIVEKALTYKLDRHATLIALGGGVVGDIAGFAASMIMRGIRFVQIPTTLLAQVDSAVGGKTGINTKSGKNLAGAFYHPRAVLVDTNVLASLPERELKAGYAEIVKYGLINNPAFFTWLEKNGAAVLSGDTSAQAHAIDASCRAKAAIIEEDPMETADIRALLNLGHSFAHGLEALGNYDGRLLHGEAVAIGINLAYEFSAAQGLCPHDDAARVRTHLQKTGLMIEPPFPVTAKELLAAMKGDKKNRDGKMTLILTKGIGQSFVARDINEDALTSFLTNRFG